MATPEDQAGGSGPGPEGVGAPGALCIGFGPDEQYSPDARWSAGLDMEKARQENIENEENRLLKKRALATPYNKKQSSKALTTLGFDIFN